MVAVDATPTLEAVLWDMDGTLVDTEPLWMAAQVALARQYGIPWDAEDSRNTVGKPMPVSAAVLQDRGIDLPVPTIIDRLVQEVVSAITPTVPWLPGAERILTDLATAHIPCALVTMAYSPVAQRVAAAAPKSAFRAVVAGDDVSHGKPHPDPYLHAAAALGVDPARCVTVEDSLNGARSAQAAGIPVLVVPGVIAVPPGPGIHFTPSLTDISVDSLRALAAYR